LILSGNTLYGTTEDGDNGDSSGGPNDGTVFKINTNGTGLSGLHNFSGGSGGVEPSGSLVVSGNTLYGTTQSGGNSDNGTLFAVNTDGTGFNILHRFGGSDGATPLATLVLSGKILYGTTVRGGGHGYGTVFAINADGTAFTSLYSFTGGSDGADPLALILAGNTLYGTAQSGGGFGNGTVFALNTDGTGFTVLHSFSATSPWTNSDGAGPGGLILSANTLYGTAGGGGGFNNGTVFALNTDGTGFTNLHTFAAGSYNSCLFRNVPAVFH